MSFASERTVKSVRKARACDGCGQLIEVGSPAVVWTGTTDGDFGTADFHVECRAAEIGINKLAGTTWGEWYGLADLETDDWPYLLSDHPVVAARFGITQARIDRVERERVESARRWKEATHQSGKADQ